ncbi:MULTISPECIES: hypothetical protein [unclassified Pseudomonas]|uniref:hypothetical protein n=1 Tax=unclassified Pseudomonas TaxID=196821 RepID=UPI001F36B43C|nr:MULTISPECIES: hypothetical protein [unclassified Pseudomonas]
MPQGSTALLDGVHKFVNVRDLDIDLIDRINPFNAAYAVLAKAMDEKSLRQVQASIAAKKVSIPEDEARELAKRALQFKNERGRLPDINSPMHGKSACLKVWRRWRVTELKLRRHNRWESPAMADMNDDELLGALGVEATPIKVASRTPREERIIAEWFLVPLYVIDEVVERIRDGSITDVAYDPQTIRLVS